MPQIWLMNSQIVNKKIYFQTQFKENFLHIDAFEASLRKRPLYIE